MSANNKPYSQPLRWSLKPSRDNGYELAWTDGSSTEGWWLSAEQVAEMLSTKTELAITKEVLSKAIQDSIESMPHARRLYPDFYADEVADAVIEEIPNIVTEPTFTAKMITDAAKESYISFWLNTDPGFDAVSTWEELGENDPYNERAHWETATRAALTTAFSNGEQ